jgi:hypothetical protein
VQKAAVSRQCFAVVPSMYSHHLADVFPSNRQTVLRRAGVSNLSRPPHCLRNVTVSHICHTPALFEDVLQE